MDNEIIISLLYRLKEKTINGEVKWRIDDTIGGFVADIGVNSVRIKKFAVKTQKSNMYFEVHILNATGQVVESVSNFNLEEYMTSSALLLLDEIYNGARRSALKTDTIIGDMLKALE